MTGEDNKWKQQYDDALDFVEENDALSADDIKQMMSDEETCTLVGDLLDCRQAMGNAEGIFSPRAKHQ